MPVAHVADNPKGLEWAKVYFAGTPAAQNSRLLRKDELQIQVHGNTLFAGWTVPIPLFPPQYTLPPACLLVEGYGRLKTSVINFAMPSGATAIMEANGFDAFATFFHPASKYAGPGTDATLGRDMVLTAYPPSAKSEAGTRAAVLVKSNAKTPNEHSPLKPRFAANRPRSLKAEKVKKRVCRTTF